MKKNKNLLFIGITFLTLFVVWTVLVKTVDVQAIGPKGSSVGFATVNALFHELTGVHMTIYTITDWLGMVPFGVCFFFACVGLVQLIKRKNLFKVDMDIIILGVYYAIVIAAFFLFEKDAVDYRPVLIEGVLEASYPSSTTLLVMTVMPSLVFQAKRRLKDAKAIKVVTIVSLLFSIFMVVARLCCGVHWLTDIVGGVFISVGLFSLYVYSIQCIKK